MNDLARNYRDKKNQKPSRQRKADESLWKAWFGMDNVYSFLLYMVVFIIIFSGLIIHFGNLY